MRLFRLNRLVVLLALIVVVIAALFFGFGGVKDVLSYRCRAAAESMHVGWAWSLNGGCFIQQPNGNWVPLDQVRYQSQ